MYVSTPFRRLAQKSRSALVVGALTLCGAFAAPSLAQTQVTNTATVTLPATVVDTNTTNNTSTVNVAVVAPRLQIAKTASSASFTAGVAASYTLQVSNTGTSATTAVATITDTIPTGLTIGTLPAGCTASGQTVTCTVASGLAAGGSTSFVIPVTPQASLNGTSLTNTATVSGGGDSTCPAAARCTSSVGPTPVVAPQLTLTKTASVGAGAFTVGAAASYTLAVRNTGTAATTAVATITDTIPTGLTIGTLPAGCTASGQTVTCTVAAGLAINATTSFVIPVTPTAAAAANVTNTATISGGGDSTCPANARCTSAVTNAVNRPQLTLAKTASSASFTVEVAASYTLQVSNTGTAATTAVATITDAVPAGLTIGTLPAGCTASGQTVTCTVAAGLAANASRSFVIPVTPTAPAPAPGLTNTATVTGGGDPACPASTRCTSSVQTPVQPVINAIDDSYNVSATGGTTTSVIVNDTTNNVAAVIGTNVTLTPGTAPTPSAGSIAMNANGTISVAPNTTAGTYGYPYQICTSPATTPPTCDSAIATVIIASAPGLTIEKTAGTPSGSTAGSTIAYSFVVTNTGNVTITGVVVDDAQLDAAAVCAVTTLAPGENTSCTGTHTITQAEVNAGVVNNSATATGTPPTGPSVTSPPDTTSTPIAQTPSQTLVKELTGDSTGGEVAVGDVLTYTVTLSNTGNTTLTNVTVNDPLTTPSSVTCASVAPGATCQLVGTYTVTQADADAGTIRNTAFATTPICPAGSTDPACITTIDTPVDNPVVSYNKSVTLPVGQTEVSVGDTLTYTLQVVVSDAATTAPVTLTDTMGQGLTPGAVNAGAFSCGAGSPLVCTLPAGTVPGTYAVTYTAIVNDLATGFVRNTVGATGDDAPTCRGTCQTDTIVTEPLPAIISYGKSVTLPAGRTQLVAGDVLTYTLTTTVAAAPTSGVLTLTDTLGNGLVLGAVTNAGAYACTGTQPLVCTLPTGTAPGVYEVTYTATVTPQASVVVRNAVVGTSDDNPVCATDCDVETPVAAPIITVNKSADPANGTAVEPGQVITYVLSVQVGQAATRAAVTLVDTPGTGLTLGAMPAGCAYNGTALTCTLPAGTAVGMHTFTYTATVDASANGRVSNVVVASSGDPTGDPPTCQSCSTEHQVDLPEIRLSKTAGAREVKIGDLVRYTLTVENVGSTDLVGGRITDTPPAGFSYVEGSLVAGDADRIATVSGSQPIRIEGVDVRAGETATLVYVMRVGAGVRPGTHVNQAQARSGTDDPVSNVATAEVVLTADALIDDSLLMGTVFNDRDGDGWQDSAALSGVKVQGGFAPGAYIANSTTVDRGAGPQPEPDASSPMLHGIAVGAIAGRQSVAEPADAQAVVIRQRLSEASFTDDFVLTSDQGVTVRMDAAGNTRVEQSGDAAKGPNAATPTVERRVSQGEGGYVVDYIIRNTGINERGIPGVRIASVEGLLIETDQYGRYHLAGMSGGAWERGRNFILKVDPSTLPAGAEFTTDNPLLRRITPGVPVRFDFGVKLPEQVIEGGVEQVELELGDVFFAPGSAEVRAQYLPVIDAMAAQVRKHRGGEVVINANGDSEGLAFQRAEAVKTALLARLDDQAAKALVVSARGNVDDPGSLVVGVDEGGALLGTVLFDTDKAVIRPEFTPLLDKIAASLEKRGGGSIAIVGHTDQRGSHAYNTALGMRRAKAVYDAIATRLSPEVRAKVRVDASNDPTAPVGVRK